MNPYLASLHPYPFEKLAALKQGIHPPADKAHIAMSMGEPQHPAPEFVAQALRHHSQGLSNYPSTKGIPALREAIAIWLTRRFKLPAMAINPETQVLPVNGTREALFAIAQCLINPRQNPVVVMPNPFYQIYEGAALLAGAEPYYLNTLEANGFLPDFDAVPDSVWQRCQLLYLCSPGNPSGAVLSAEHYQKALQLAERFDFVIASDECYSELYDDENQPPMGLLQAAHQLGDDTFKRCIVFHSLSKRSNVPGLRSGFVAGDAEILKAFLLYRTYHGCAMSPPTQFASIQAWQDEQHVIENRRLYREKFDLFIDLVGQTCPVTRPPASFYIWLKTPQLGNNHMLATDFVQQLYAEENLTLVPGSYLSRETQGIDPGLHFVRIALVAPLADIKIAAERITHFIKTLNA